MRTVKVVGAGFSGLVTAYFLIKAGYSVQVCEKSDRAGGLIQTIHAQHGLVETAANGILNSQRLEAMCADIGVQMLPARGMARKRFVYRGRPRQIPLTLSDLFIVGFGMFKNVGRWQPHQFETITEWGHRVLGEGTTDYLLAPALGGIYAGDPNQLSASLIFGRASLPTHLGTYRSAKPRLRGTVSPHSGMQQLIDGLVSYLSGANVDFVFDDNSPANKTEPTIICLSASAAAKYLSDVAPETSAQLGRIRMLSLVTATCFFKREPRLKGFGCLFPGNQRFRARGVLFNEQIFENRAAGHSETWIFGGALDPEAIALNDQELVSLIGKERQRLNSSQEDPVEVHITRRPDALPHYSIELERVLTNLTPGPRNIRLVGNYLGGIGLRKILERAAYVVDNLGE